VTDSEVAMDTPGLTWTLDGETRIRPFEPDDALAIFQLIQSNRDHLDRWLRWSNTIQSEADAQATVALYLAKRAAGTGFHSGIWVAGRLAGGVVCRDLDRQHRCAEIGYWLGAEFVGRGLATRAASLAIDYLTGSRGMHRIEMQCGAQNVRSRAVPERLGFRLEGIRRESYWITTHFEDSAVYGLLAGEWPSAPTRDGGRC
jgi:ribosomal-protein-serine acetyltransferase